MIKMKRGKFALLIISTALITLLVAGGILVAISQFNNVVVVKKSDYDTMSKITKEYSKLYAMQQAINEKSLWKNQKEKQMEAVYNGLLESLGDKYSTYLNKEDYSQLKEYVSGTFTGIGLAFIQDGKGNFCATGVVTGSPADLAGLKAGDILLEVDGKTFTDDEKMMTAIRGKEGTKVSITYKREGAEKTVDIVRAVVENITVGSTVLKGNVGYISISAFEHGTAEQFKTELAEMESKGVKGLVIDLRNNGGGVLEESIEVADMLLPEGTITYTKDRQGKKETYNSDSEATKLKYVLLVNQNTASASEVITAAVKDNNGGKVVGTKTFGKGIIQGIIEFGDDSAMKLTIAQYFSPKGNKIQDNGIEPNYKVGIKAGTDKQLEKALELLR